MDAETSGIAMKSWVLAKSAGKPKAPKKKSGSSSSKHDQFRMGSIGTH
jgi:hypothetical protein